MISIDEEHTDLLAGYIALWDKVSGVTESTFQQISLGTTRSDASVVFSSHIYIRGFRLCASL